MDEVGRWTTSWSSVCGARSNTKRSMSRITKILGRLIAAYWSIFYSITRNESTRVTTTKLLRWCTARTKSNNKVGLASPCLSPARAPVRSANLSFWRLTTPIFSLNKGWTSRRQKTPIVIFFGECPKGIDRLRHIKKTLKSFYTIRCRTKTSTE